MKYILIIFIFATFPLNLFAISPEDQAQIDLANRLDKQAILDYKQGRHTDAETLFKRSLKIREKIHGAEHPEVALVLNNLAFIYENRGSYAEAEQFYKRSLKIFEKGLGQENPYTATALKTLGILYDKQERYAEAEPL